MAATIGTCKETEQLQSVISLNITDIIKFINNLFDCLNSRLLYSNNPYNCALTYSGTAKQFLIEVSTYFVNLQKIKLGKLLQPPYIKFFTQTINGIL
jgi:hypothetical protein